MTRTLNFRSGIYHGISYNLNSFALFCDGHTDGLKQDCSNPVANALELLSCSKSSILSFLCDTSIHVHREALLAPRQYYLPVLFMVALHELWHLYGFQSEVTRMDVWLPFH